MYKKLLAVTGAVSFFLAGAYVQENINITPAVTAAFKTAGELAGDFYSGVLVPLAAGVDSTSALFALGGLLALLSVKVLGRYRRL